MADKKISALTALTAANVAPATDVVPIVDTSATETKKVTAKDLVDGALNGGTANGVLYLDGSKAATSGSALTFDGSNLATTGTASATKLIPTGGTATGNGMYLPATNVVAFSTNGSERARFNSSGDLGVGTSSVSARVHVVSAAASVQIRWSDATNGTANLDTAAGFSRMWSNVGLSFGTGAETFTERMRITSAGSVVAGASAALATTATDGFLYVPTCAGTPTGTPTAITGMAPIVVNTTNNKLYFYSGGAWRDAGP